MGRSLTPGAVRLPALIGSVSSTTLPTLGAGRFAITIIVICLVGIGIAIVVVVVVGFVVGVVVFLLRIWPLPFSSFGRFIEVGPSTP